MFSLLNTINQSINLGIDTYQLQKQSIVYIEIIFKQLDTKFLTYISLDKTNLNKKIGYFFK